VCALLCTIQLGFLSPAIEQLRGELEQVLGGHKDGKSFAT
jgi:predicted Zn-dependent protease